MAYYNNPDIDWSTVAENGGGAGRFEPGGYVVRITHAEWGDGCIEVVWDVAEGDRAGFFDGADEWRHRQRVWYKGRAQGMFKHFLATVERSNPGSGFSADRFDNNAEALEGLLVGALVQTYYYWSTKYDESRDSLEIAIWKDADDIRTGNYTLPEPRDARTGAQRAAADAVAAMGAVKAADPDDIPF